MQSLLIFFLGVSSVLSKVYFHEKCDEDLSSRWVYSADTSVTHGILKATAKKFGAEGDLGLKTMNDSSYYHVSAKLGETINTAKSSLYLQYIATYEQDIDCGGAYVKLLPDFDQTSFLGSTPYSIMFGPDMCGFSTRKVHVILHHNGKNYEIKNEIAHPLDKKSHLFEFRLTTDKKFAVLVDNSIKTEGKLEDHFSLLEPKQIDDPEDKKPSDWIDDMMMPDASDTKPEDWDDRKTIVDPNAAKPEDWNDQTDGEWEPDSIPNSAYKGEWSPKMIKNPLFKGAWAPRLIDNPNYKPDVTIADYQISVIGFDLWQVASGTVFDEIFLTDNADEAKKHAEQVFSKIQEQNKRLEEEEEIQRKKLSEEHDKLKDDMKTGDSNTDDVPSLDDHNTPADDDDDDNNNNGAHKHDHGHEDL